MSQDPLRRVTVEKDLPRDRIQQSHPNSIRRFGLCGSKSALLLFAATLAAYWPALRAGFVWDDDGFVTAPALRSWTGLARIWTDPKATEQYYPVLHSAFWIQHRLWGDSPLPYHLVNILLHASAACLFALVLRNVFAPEGAGPGAPQGTGTAAPAAAIPGRDAPAWFAAFLFALHPVCVQSVAWISEQKNTLSTVFYLLAALAYLRFEKDRREPALRDTTPGREAGTGQHAQPGNGTRKTAGREAAASYLLATFLFLLALLSKTVTATLPGALLVVLWWRRGRLAWRDGVPLLPWLALGAGAGLFSGWVERVYIGASGPAFALSFPARCLVAGRAVWFYLGKLLWPAHLVFIYPRWRIDPTSAGQYAYVLGVAALIAVLWRLRLRTRGPLAALLFFIGSLFPTLGFLNVYAFIFSYVADHWQYLASLGIIALAAGGWGRWMEKVEGEPPPPKSSGIASRLLGLRARMAAAAVLALLGVLTWRQCRIYRDVETFYLTLLEENPSCWMAHNNLGEILSGKPNRRADALAQYAAALRLKPDFPEAHNNLANLLATQPDTRADAIAHYETALRLKPENAEVHNNLANLLAADPGRRAEALAHYEAALRLKPDYADAHNNLGSLLAADPQRQADALAHYQAALRSKPDFPEAHNNLANLLAADPGRRAEALAHYEAALRLKPDYAEAHNNLANLLVTEPGRQAEAIAHYEAAIRSKPDYAEAHYNLAIQLAQMPGRQPEAIAHFEDALKANPRYADAHVNLAILFARDGRLNEAAAHLETALAIDPNDRRTSALLKQVQAALSQ